MSIEQELAHVRERLEGVSAAIRRAPSTVHGSKLAEHLTGLARSHQAQYTRLTELLDLQRALDGAKGGKTC